MRILFSFLANIFGKNLKATPASIIRAQLKEPRPLPMGRIEFNQWSDRIISGALVPGATISSQKYTLANLIMHLGPTESHKEDAFFIHSLRKFAANQVADTIRMEHYAEAKSGDEERQKRFRDLLEKARIPDSATSMVQDS